MRRHMVYACKGYRYYKSMREIIRAENGGDLTYFMEYYLELLVRAIDDRKERIRRREQEAMEKEREMTAQPLRSGASDGDTTGTVEPQQAEPGGEQDDASRTEASSMSGRESQQAISFSQRFNEIYEQCGNKNTRIFLQKVLTYFKSGVSSFTAKDWSDMWNSSPKFAVESCNLICEKGLATCRRVGLCNVYTFIPDVPTEANIEKECMTDQGDAQPQATMC